MTPYMYTLQILIPSEVCETLRVAVGLVGTGSAVMTTTTGKVIYIL